MRGGDPEWSGRGEEAQRMVRAQSGHSAQPGEVREGFLEEEPRTISKRERGKEPWSVPGR